MKTIITIIIIALILREVFSLIRDNKRQNESIAMSREVKRIRNEWNNEMDTIRESNRRQEEIEREVRRQACEAEREREKQIKLWEKQRKEDERRDAQLAKHEERLFKLEQKLELAQREEEHQEEIVTAIRVDMAGLEAYVSYMKEKGLLCKGKEEELRKLNDKLYAAETKLIKARQARELCEMQMSA